MAYLRNTWYGIGIAADLGRSPKPITVLEEHVVLFRRLDGRAVALGNVCPHRFAPLHLGKLRGDYIECPYHGLQFDSTGGCVVNPHARAFRPDAARVHAYPIEERHGFLWIWMGEPEKADASSIADFSVFDDHERFATVSGYVRIEANYQLVTDNLLDLTHAEYIHPRIANPGQYGRARRSVHEEGDTIWSKYDNPNEPLTELSKSMWDAADGNRADMHSYMRWDLPCTLLVEVGTTPVGRPRIEGVLRPTALLLSPESEYVTHYFWMSARNRRIDDAEFSEKVRQTIEAAFVDEDKPIIEAQQRTMGTREFDTMKPVLLNIDTAAMKARRVLQKRLAAECAS